MSLAEEVHCRKYRAPEESRAEGVPLREGPKWSQQGEAQQEGEPPGSTQALTEWLFGDCISVFGRMNLGCKLQLRFLKYERSVVYENYVCKF